MRRFKLITTVFLLTATRSHGAVSASTHMPDYREIGNMPSVLSCTFYKTKPPPPYQLPIHLDEQPIKEDLARAGFKKASTWHIGLVFDSSRKAGDPPPLEVTPITLCWVRDLCSRMYTITLYKENSQQVVDAQRKSNLYLPPGVSCAHFFQACCNVACTLKTQEMRIPEIMRLIYTNFPLEIRLIASDSSGSLMPVLGYGAPLPSPFRTEIITTDMNW